MNATLEYTKNAVMTASRAKLVVLMYEGAISHVEQARFHLERNNVAGCGTAISRAYSIVSELKVALDFEASPEVGEVARRLESLYTFVQDRLVQTNIERDAGDLQAVLDVLRTVKEGWDGIVHQQA